MRLNKKNCLLISNMNNAYDILFKKWLISNGEIDYKNKMKLNRVITENFEEQKRGFLKSELDYQKSAHFFLVNFQKLSYNKLHLEITEILLHISELKITKNV